MKIKLKKHYNIIDLSIDYSFEFLDEIWVNFEEPHAIYITKIVDDMAFGLVYNDHNCHEVDEIKSVSLGNLEFIGVDTYIYVMIDENTGYYKIGRSKNPKIRERTLQSEKPTIKMLFNIEAFNHNEKELHEKFKSKRIRGEWFSLDDKDLKYISTYLS